MAELAVFHLTLPVASRGITHGPAGRLAVALYNERMFV